VGRGDLYPGVQLRVRMCASWAARGGGARAESPDFRRNRTLVTQTTLLPPLRPATTVLWRYRWPWGEGGRVQRKKRGRNDEKKSITTVLSNVTDRCQKYISVIRTTPLRYDLLQCIAQRRRRRRRTSYSLTPLPHPGRCR